MTNPVSGSQPPPATTQGSSSSSPTSSLNQTDFLKLLTGQLQNEDPMQPTDDSQWIGEMAQFTVVQQVSSMNSSNSKILSALDSSQTLSLIGHKVTYTDSNGNSTSGTVDKVDIDSGNATLTVDGQTGIDASNVTEVQ